MAVTPVIRFTYVPVRSRMSHPIAFLRKKGWHPKSKQNVRRKWIKEQNAENQRLRSEEKIAELKRERRRTAELRAAAATGDAAAEKELRAAEMSFMYESPPGMNVAEGREGNQKGETANDVGEDENAKQTIERLREWTALEKAAGRRGRRRRSATVSEQMERFPELRNAPVEGSYTKHATISFKALGKVYRQVQCRRCGEWGHRAGDRECRLRDTLGPRQRHELERQDPLTEIKRRLGTTHDSDATTERRTKRRRTGSEDSESDGRSSSSGGGEGADRARRKRRRRKEKRSKRRKKKKKKKKRKRKDSHE